MFNYTATPPKAHLINLISSGAIVIDVRSPRKFKEYSLHDSFNFPFSTLGHNWKILKSFDRPIILVCEDGELCIKAKKTLENHGIDVHIGGPWREFI